MSSAPTLSSGEKHVACKLLSTLLLGRRGGCISSRAGAKVSARERTAPRQAESQDICDGMGIWGYGGRVTRFSAAQIRLATLATQEKRGHRRCRRQKAARRLRLQARCWRRRWYLRLLTGRQACSVRRNACWPAREPAVAFCQESMNLAQVAQASLASRHLAPGHAPASGHAPLERGLGARLSQA